VYAAELAAAERAGLDGLLAAGCAEPAAPAATRAADGPGKKVVHHEIGGVDVLQVDAALAALAGRGVYAEAAMGCTGPVVLVADDDAAEATAILVDARLI
jgi:betaine reductase